MAAGHPWQALVPGRDVAYSLGRAEVGERRDGPRRCNSDARELNTSTTISSNPPTPWS